jgi:tRNA pseudouridine38-40 synthase
MRTGKQLITLLTCSYGTCNVLQKCQQQLENRGLCVRNYSSRLSTTKQRDVEEAIACFWKAQPFQHAKDVVRTVLIAGSASSGRQLVQMNQGRALNDTTIFSNFYSGNALYSINKASEFTKAGNQQTRKKQSFCLVLAYDGRHFCGWQRQPNNLSRPSVQQVIESVIEAAFVENGRPDIRVSGRTDSGVHALGQIARVRILSPMSIKGQRTAVTSDAVFDVLNVAAKASNYTWRCLSVMVVSDKFHPTFDTKTRSYIYILDAKAVLALINMATSATVVQNCTQHRVLSHFQNLMIVQLESLVGKEFDYYSFSHGKVKTESTLCTLQHATVRLGQVNTSKADPLVVIFEFTGNRFLRRMIRMLVGTCIHYAVLSMATTSAVNFTTDSVLIDPSILMDICNSRDRNQQVKTAPPGGLIFLSANMTVR